MNKLNGWRLVTRATALDSDKPGVVLQDWAAFALLLPQLGQPSLHLLGTNLATGHARISSAVTAVHVSRHVVATQSRAYDLVGEPGRASQNLAALKILTRGWRAELLGDMTRTLFAPERFLASHLVLAPEFIH